MVNVELDGYSDLFQGISDSIMEMVHTIGELFGKGVEIAKK